MSNLEILDIIPLDKYPAAAPDYFSYISSIQLNGEIPLYSLVKIPLKNKIKYGFIINKKTIAQSKLLIKKSEYKLKSIKEVLYKNALIFDNQIKFAYWLKNYANISLSHAFSFLLQWIPKCAKANFEIKNEIRQLAEKIKNDRVKFKSIILKKLDKKLLKDLPALIIVPKEEYIPYLKFLISNFKIFNVMTVDLSLPAKKFREVLQKIYKGEKVLFIGTKNSIFLPWQNLKKIIIYEEGSLFYKESFHPPYFDYLNLIEKFSEIANIELIKISSFPSIKHYLSKNVKNKKYPEFNFETIKNDIESVENLLTQSFNEKNGRNKCKKIIIFSPQKIIAQKIICERCKTEITCKKCDFSLTLSENKTLCKSCFTKNDIPEKCPDCENFEFQIKGIGAEWLARYLKRLGFDLTFIKEYKDIKKIYKKREFTIIGSQNLLSPNIPSADLFLFLNFDWGFQSSDIFLKEKYLRILEFLSKKSKKIILQTTLSDEILQKIKTGEILNDLLKERENQFLPPYSRMLKLINKLQNLQTLNKRMLEIRKEIDKRKSNFKERIEIWGPFLKKIPKRMSRHQLELILRVDYRINLKQLLKWIRVDEIEVDSYSMN